MTIDVGASSRFASAIKADTMRLPFGTLRGLRKAIGAVFYALKGRNSHCTMLVFRKSPAFTFDANSDRLRFALRNHTRSVIIFGKRHHLGSSRFNRVGSIFCRFVTGSSPYLIERQTSAPRLDVSPKRFAAQVFSLFILAGAVDSLSDYGRCLANAGGG